MIGEVLRFSEPTDVIEDDSSMSEVNAVCEAAKGHPYPQRQYAVNDTCRTFLFMRSKFVQTYLPTFYHFDKLRFK